MVRAAASVSIAGGGGDEAQASSLSTHQMSQSERPEFERLAARGDLQHGEHFARPRLAPPQASANAHGAAQDAARQATPSGHQAKNASNAPSSRQWNTSPHSARSTPRR